MSTIDEELDRFESGDKSLASGNLARALTPKVISGAPKSIDDEMVSFEKESELGRKPSERAVLHEDSSLYAASQAPKSIDEELDHFESSQSPSLVGVDPNKYVAKKGPQGWFTRGALYVLGAEENATVAGLRKG